MGFNIVDPSAQDDEKKIRSVLKLLRKRNPKKAQKPLPNPKSEPDLIIHDLSEMTLEKGVRTLLATEGRDAAIRDCRRKVEMISRECRLNNVKYRDPHFDLWDNESHCLHGLTKDEDEDSTPGGAMRVNEIYDEPHFVVDGFDAGDIQQGAVGDCWFLAACATIANVPSLLESICVARDEKVGVYGFIFFRDGEWISEVVDDQLFVTSGKYHEADGYVQALFQKEEHYVQAVQRGSNALYFGRCADSNETWLALMEKAFAKAHGDYASISGGFTGEAVEDLTGGVTSEIIARDILDRDLFWSEGLLKVNKDFLFSAAIVCSSASEVNGVITGHAYSVLQAVEVDGKRMIKVRNPWGNSEWKGAWSDGSPEWTPEMMTLLAHRFGDDGAFWMTYEDFLKTFVLIDRTRLFSSDWAVAQCWTRTKVQWPTRFADEEFKITVTETGPVVIVLHQADTRFFEGLNGQYTFHLAFRVRREGENEYYVRAQQPWAMTRSVNKEVYLEAGTWYVSFRVSREKTGEPRSRCIEEHMKAESSKFMQIARNYDYAMAKAYESVVESEDSKDMEAHEDSEAAHNESVASGTKGEDKKVGKEKCEEEGGDGDAEEEVVEDGEEETAEDGEEKEPEDGEEDTSEEQTESESEKKEKDESEEDSFAALGLRVYAMDKALSVELVAREQVEHVLDPDDSCVQSFLQKVVKTEHMLSSQLSMK